MDNKDNLIEIKKIKTTNDYVMLFIDEDKIMVSIDDYFKYALQNKKEIDQELFDTLKYNEKVLKAYRSCLRKISIKDYSINQIRKNLYSYEINKEDIEDIINKLISYGLLDDNKYCLNKAVYYDKVLYSHKIIKQKLLKDGISEEMINNNLIYDYDREYEKASILANKYLKTINNKAKNAKRQSILNKLVNNGYSYDISKSICNNLEINNKNELELLQKEYDKLLRKYQKKYEGYELNSKIYNSLLLKGFNSQDIKKIVG